MDGHLKMEFKKLRENIFFVLVAMLILGLLLLIVGVSIEAYPKISEILKGLGKTIVGVTVFTFLLKSRAFVNTIINALDVKSRHWENYSLETIEKVIENISTAFPQVKCNGTNLKLAHESKELAKADFITLQADLAKKGRSACNENELHLLDRVFFTNEAKITKTVMLNGAEISNFEFDIEIIKDGKFCFRYIVSTLFDSVNFPNFTKYIENAKKNPIKRFTDFAFSCKILDFKRDDKLVHTGVPALTCKAIDEGTTKSKKIELSLSPECK